MGVTKWSDIKHKVPLERREEIRREASAELERMGFGKLRQARKLTQIELAERLDVPQGAISRMERRTDLLLSTLRQYIEGMGGRLELVATFPDAQFLLDTLAPQKSESDPRKARGKTSSGTREKVGAQG